MCADTGQIPLHIKFNVMEAIFFPDDSTHYLRINASGRHDIAVEATQQVSGQTDRWTQINKH